MSAIENNDNFSYQLVKLSALDKKMLLLTFEMIEDNLKIEDLGNHPISLLGNFLIESFIEKNIIVENGSNIQSSSMYLFFIKWCKTNKINTKIIDFFNQKQFSLFFSKFCESKRMTSGIFWQNVNFNDSNIQNNKNFQLESNEYISLFKSTKTCEYFEELSEHEIILDLESIDNIKKVEYLDIVEYCAQDKYLKYIECKDNQLHFCVITKTNNLKMKIIPYEKKYITTKDYINDLTIIENNEVTIHKILNNLLVLKQTPHINMHISNYYTNLENLIKLNFIDSSMNLQLENFYRYADFDNKYKNDDFCVNCIVKISEYCDKESLLDFIKKHYKKFTLLHWKSLFFQVISVLAVIQSNFPSFRHNNYKPNELYVLKTDNKNILSYRICKNTYKLPNIGYQIKIDDFSWANINNIAKNTKLDLPWVKAIPITKTQNRYYDMHYFFNTLITFIPGFMQDPCIHDETKKFISDILPTKFDNLTTRRGRLIPDGEYLLPVDVIETNDFFKEFKK